MDLSVHLQKMITSLKKTWELTLKYDTSGKRFVIIFKRSYIIYLWICTTANLDHFLNMAMEIAEVDIQNTHEKESLDLADDAQTEEELDEVS